MPGSCPLPVLGGVFLASLPITEGNIEALAGGFSPSGSSLRASSDSASLGAGGCPVFLGEINGESKPPKSYELDGGSLEGEFCSESLFFELGVF